MGWFLPRRIVLLLLLRRASHGRSVAVLLSESEVSRLRSAWGGEPNGLHGVWPEDAVEVVVLPNAQGTVFGYRPYKTALLAAYGEEVRPPRTGKPGRPRLPYRVPGPNLRYAVVHKTRRKGRVVHVEERVIFGDEAAVRAALARSAVSHKVNTAFVERHNGTDRNRNARKVRRTYCFSKDGDVHEAVTYFTYYSYNFCWAVRTLRQQTDPGHWQNRTPAMAAGLSDHVWSLPEWLAFPSVQL